MLKLDTIVVHCSASPWGCSREIRKWHTDPKPQGNGWSDIGYHFVILNGRILLDLYLDTMDGAIEAGRRLDGDSMMEQDEIGAHTLGYNSTAIGVCLIGERKNGAATFTINQIDSLKFLLFDLCRQYGIAADSVVGHCETESGKSQGKTCPDFDMSGIRMWLKGRV